MIATCPKPREAANAITRAIIAYLELKGALAWRNNAGMAMLKGRDGKPQPVRYGPTGSGDVLAGMIGGLLGQGMDPFLATQLSVYLHSLSGEYAARAQGHRSMTAPDIIENIGNAFKEIKAPGAKTLPMEGRATLL